MKNVTKLSARQKNYLKTKSMVDMILAQWEWLCCRRYFWR